MIRAADLCEAQMDGFIVSPVAINPSVFDPAATKPVDLLQFNLNSRWVVGYMGTLTAWHGVDLFFEVARLLRDAGHDAVIAAFGGDPEQVQRLRERVQLERVGSHLQFLASVPHNHVPSYLAAMNVGLIPDTQDWSSPTKFFELASMERPVVAARCPSVEEVFGSGEQPGLLFERGNARDVVRCLMELRENPQRALQCGCAGRKRVLQNYSWSRNVARIMSLYAKMGARGVQLPPDDGAGPGDPAIEEVVTL
jgi:glycosyltransferase involved in cell wall biosynthesis